MKRVIIALTTAAVLCGAGASFAQPAASSKNWSAEKPVTIKIERHNVPAAEGMGAENVVMVNGKTIKIRAGSSEARERIALAAADLRSLRATFNGRVCTLRSIPAIKSGEAVDTITFRIKGSKPNASGMATKTMGAEKPFHCEVLVTVRKS